MTTKIFFVRHGQIDNPNKIFYGRLLGFGLSLEGRKQILKTALFLSKQKVDAIYSSPLLRTKQTAKIIGNVLHLPINYSDDLLEIKSSMQGKPNDYIQSHTNKFNPFASSENNIIGETIDQVAKRMQEFITEIKKIYPGKNIVAVTHGDPIMIVKALLENLPIDIDSIRPVNGYIQEGKMYVTEFKSL